MPAPELLYLLHGDPAELTETLVGMRVADIAEALRNLPPGGAAKVFAALPFDLAVQVFDEPELDHRYEILQRMETEAAVALVEAMSADQQTDVFRELHGEDRARLLERLDAQTRQSLKLLLKYPGDSAGGIMTTEVLSVPSDWSVQQTLEYIRGVARVKETVYVVYLIDANEHLSGVVSLRQLM